MENQKSRLRLRDIADIRTGYPFREKIESVVEGTHRVVQIKDIGSDHRINQGSLFSVNMPASADSYLLKAGDVLFQSRGARNFGAPVVDAISKTIASGHLFVIRPRRNIMPEYLAWYINQPSAQAHIKAHQRGSYVPLVPKDALNDLEVAVPPIEIQRVIVELERLRVKEEELQKALCERRAELIRAVCGGLLKSNESAK